MDDGLRQTFLTRALPELAGTFRLAAYSLTVVQDHRNFVYRASGPTGEVIFKVLPSAESHHPLLLGEMDWMAHLRANGVAVPQPCRSREGNLVESRVVDGLHLSAYCLQKVEGQLWGKCSDEREVIGPVGQLAGRMHRVSVGYRPAAAGATLIDWSEMSWFKSPADGIHPSMPGVIENARELSMLATSPCAMQDFENVGRHNRHFAWMKHNFENDVPFVDVDFSRWSR